MRRMLLGMVLAGMGLACAGCDCLDSGDNGFGPPEQDEFQLVFDNVVSRNTPVYVNGEHVGTVCQETGDVTLGNFPVDECTVIRIRSEVSQTDCYISPNCTTECSAQECSGNPCLDTRPYAGRQMKVTFTWSE